MAGLKINGSYTLIKALQTLKYCFKSVKNDSKRNHLK